MSIFIIGLVSRFEVQKLCSATKENIPPLLPEALGSRLTGRMRGALLSLFIGADDDQRMLSRTDVAQFLTGFTFNHKWILVVIHLLLQAIMICLQLLCLLLLLLYT